MGVHESRKKVSQGLLELQESFSFSELETLVSNNQLITGGRYTLNDFETIHVIPYTTDIYTGNVEPLVLTASSSNTFHKEVESLNYPQDSIHYDFSNNLCEDGTTPRKGKIIYRKDNELEIETYYDWREVTFRTYKILSKYYEATEKVNETEFNVNLTSTLGTTAQWRIWQVQFPAGTNDAGAITVNVVGTNATLTKPLYKFDGTTTWGADELSGALGPLVYCSVRDVFFLMNHRSCGEGIVGQYACLYNTPLLSIGHGLKFNIDTNDYVDVKTFNDAWVTRQVHIGYNSDTSIVAPVNVFRQHATYINLGSESFNMIFMTASQNVDFRNQCHDNIFRNGANWCNIGGEFYNNYCEWTLYLYTEAETFGNTFCTGKYVYKFDMSSKSCTYLLNDSGNRSWYYFFRREINGSGIFGTSGSSGNYIDGVEFRDSINNALVGYMDFTEKIFDYELDTGQSLYETPIKRKTIDGISVDEIDIKTLQTPVGGVISVLGVDADGRVVDAGVAPQSGQFVRYDITPQGLSLTEKENARENIGIFNWLQEGIGTSALQVGLGSEANGSYTVSIGRSTGDGAVGTYGVYLGHSAGKDSSSNESIFLGRNAGEGVDSGSHNIAIGFDSLLFLSGENNVGIGRESGDGATGSFNVFLGSEAGESNSAHVVNYGIFIGERSGRFSNGDHNILAHRESAYELRGDNNIIAGVYSSGYSNVSNSIRIGSSEVDPDVVTEDDGRASEVVLSSFVFSNITEADVDVPNQYLNAPSHGITPIGAVYNAKLERISGTGGFTNTLSTPDVNYRRVTVIDANTLHVESTAYNSGDAVEELSIVEIIDNAVGIGYGAFLEKSNQIKLGNSNITEVKTSGVIKHADAINDDESVTLGQMNAVISGTTNTIPKFTGANTIGDSQITDDGTNVGIGTPTPDKLLHIQASGVTTEATLKLVATSTNGNPLSAIEIGAFQANAFDETSSLMLFRTGSSGVLTERWRIDQSGIFQSNGAQTIRTSSGDLTLATGGGDGNVIIDPNGTGKVGVNITSPYGLMHLDGANSDILLHISTGLNTNASTGYLTFGGQQGIRSAIRGIGVGGGFNRQDLGFYTLTNTPTSFTGQGTSDLSERMRLTYNGNLLLGTTTDTGEKLQVNGLIKAVDDVEVTTIGSGFIITSPDATRWRVTIDNTGNLTTTSL